MDHTPCKDKDTGACFWIEKDLCSACAPAKQRAEFFRKHGIKPGRPARATRQDWLKFLNR